MTSAERVAYLDSSAIVKLAVIEQESVALRRFLQRRSSLASSSLARAEVGRALAPHGERALRRGRDILATMDLIRVSDDVLEDAAALHPLELRTLDAIHVATALLLGDDLAYVVTYDMRMASAAQTLGCTVATPS